MRTYPLQGQVGGGWALDIESFLGPVKCIGPIGKCHFTSAQEGGFRAHTVGGGWGSRCIKELNGPARAAQVHKGT